VLERWRGEDVDRQSDTAISPGTMGRVRGSRPSRAK
jgi:hypothetical protein